MSIALVILASGKGTRMRSDLPKVLHKVAGAPLLAHAMASGASLSPERTVIVTGHGAEQVKAAAREIDETATCVLQSEQLGTGHAVLQARPALEGFSGDVIVLYGDTPFIRPETLEAMAEARRSHDVVVLGFTAADPGKYGRLVMEGDALMQIVEFKDAGLRERAIDFCNSGVISASADTFFALLDRVGNDNASGEYYLTDVIAMAVQSGLSVETLQPEFAWEVDGINDRVQLSRLERIYQLAQAESLMRDGVTLRDPNRLDVRGSVQIASDVIIDASMPAMIRDSGKMWNANDELQECTACGQKK